MNSPVFGDCPRATQCQLSLKLPNGVLILKRIPQFNELDEVQFQNCVIIVFILLFIYPTGFTYCKHAIHLFLLILYLYGFKMCIKYSNLL